MVLIPHQTQETYQPWQIEVAVMIDNFPHQTFHLILLCQVNNLMQLVNLFQVDIVYHCFNSIFCSILYQYFIRLIFSQPKKLSLKYRTCKSKKKLRFSLACILVNKYEVLIRCV